MGWDMRDMILDISLNIRAAELLVRNAARRLADCPERLPAERYCQTHREFEKLIYALIQAIDHLRTTQPQLEGQWLKLSDKH